MKFCQSMSIRAMSPQMKEEPAVRRFLSSQNSLFRLNFSCFSRVRSQGQGKITGILLWHTRRNTRRTQKLVYETNVKEARWIALALLSEFSSVLFLHYSSCHYFAGSFKILRPRSLLASFVYIVNPSVDDFDMHTRANSVQHATTKGYVLPSLMDSSITVYVTFSLEY